jgi:intracellular sulfur oxidation DsrE/DsrF family protein
VTARTTVLISDDVGWALDLAAAWLDAGDAVTAVLCDSAAAAARAGHVRAAAVGAAVRAGVTVAAEEGALQRRGLAVDRLVDGVKILDLDEVADLLEASTKAVWL